MRAILPGAVGRTPWGTPDVALHARFSDVTSIDEGVPAAPRHWEADVLLRDGRTAHIRPIEPSDAEQATNRMGNSASQRMSGSL